MSDPYTLLSSHCVCGTTLPACTGEFCLLFSVCTFSTDNISMCSHRPSSRSQHTLSMSQSQSPCMYSLQSGLRHSSAQLCNRSGGRAYEGSGSTQGDKVRCQYHCECTDHTNSSSLHSLRAYAVTWIELGMLHDCSLLSVLILTLILILAPPSSTRVRAYNQSGSQQAAGQAVACRNSQVFF